MSANDIQVGGDHYKVGGEEHWDRVYRLFGAGYFVGCITKYVERYQKKNGYEDLLKAQHFLSKLIEIEGIKPKEEKKLTREEKIVPENLRSKAAVYSSTRDATNGDFQCEGYYGDGTNLYKCRHCGTTQIRAKDLEDAYAVHGTCALAHGYLAQP